jgi:hypothetical protein
MSGFSTMDSTTSEVSVTLKKMRRLLAILLLAAFGLPAVAPLLALGQDADSNLPLCCRRNGAHHCTMGTAQESSAPAVSTRCASFPQPTAVAPSLKLTALIATQPLLKLPVATFTAPARAETQRRISRERSRHTRGPPTETLL